ncbi:MAG: NAD(P)-dependent oxidoreductase [Alphaproteobacteria bacterium]
MNAATKLGFVGLGIMGEPMCRNMSVAGLGSMTVFDLKAAPVERLQALGAQKAGSPADVSRNADIIFLSLPGGPEVEKIVLGSGGLLDNGRAGQIVVDMSTCPVAVARKLAGELEPKGMIFADAPVARTRQAAEDGTLSIMVGSDEETFRRIHPILRAAATDITHCGGVGAGQTVKLLNNMLLIQSVVALAEAFTIGERAGVTREVLAEALGKGSADSFALRNHGLKAMVPGNFPIGAFATDYAHKDLSYALELAGECGVRSPAAELAKSLLERTSEAGYGQEYFPVLMKLVEGSR